MMIEHVVIRYGEISLKGKNRHEFEQRLFNNLKRSVSDMPEVRLQRTGGRFIASLGGADVERVMERFSNVFGVFSQSPVEVTALSVDEMVEAAKRVIQEEQGEHPARTFKIEVKRANKRFPLDSLQLAAEVGGRVLEDMPSLTVDVHHPDTTVFIEVRENEAYVFGRRVPAVGGLPVGTAGRVGLLLSGGIDSPVAGWLSLKRGVDIEAIHFHSFPFTSQRALDKVEDLAQILANWAGRVRLHTVHFTDVQTEIRKHCPDSLGITVMRRMMLRIATEIAKQRKLLALVTGESLGQVASQTLESIRTINSVTNVPILRPLIAEDKVDIIRRARQIGTYETSILPYEDCCTIFVPKSPRTRPKPEEAEAAEVNLEIDRLVTEAVERTTQKTFVAKEFIEAPVLRV
ncbi:tRNA uracil 4-sulfurtransferase ThiI [Alicyclobacillus ferrooxydans]|uniref:Probable tRNA sulfurtransferase n=1 Tax=Alicyclobacillus ferrooxydans TaxID=471514 RepID=A0A0P9D7L9_9BACL|nr:tRNA uracil 4-sulfurtransferase ThiI [Alicyclobacillus ferrooxydans]KPV45305.1 thiamine biosynthesis protein ThiI [Alicyclobacillus ferrooxydans]